MEQIKEMKNAKRQASKVFSTLLVTLGQKREKQASLRAQLKELEKEDSEIETALLEQVKQGEQLPPDWVAKEKETRVCVPYQQTTYAFASLLEPEKKDLILEAIQNGNFSVPTKEMKDFSEILLAKHRKGTPAEKYVVLEKIKSK